MLTQSRLETIITRPDENADFAFAADEDVDVDDGDGDGDLDVDTDFADDNTAVSSEVGDAL